MDITSLARSIFQNDRYATKATGIVIEKVGDREAECSLALDDRHRNARGAVMGGVMFTLADFAAAIAANSTEIDEVSTVADLHWLSLNATIHYLSPATGHSLSAKCTALKHGRSTALYQTTIADDSSGRTIAIIETTMIRI